MEIQPLTKEYIFFKKLEKKTVFYSKSGKPLSRIELYQSGANRIIRRSTLSFSEERPERHKDDIREFSHTTRRRYFYYVNSLDLSEMRTIFFLTFTISTHLGEYLTKAGMKAAYESIFKKLKKLEFDHVYKVEYTENEIPHLHLLIFSKNLHGFNFDHERIKKARDFSAMWTDSIYDNHNLSVARFYIDDLDETYNKMSVTSCELQIPQDLKKLIFYFADYTSKNKDYQNIIPEKFWGTRTWGKRSSVYGKLRVDPVYIDINQEIFDYFYHCICIQWKKEKAKKCAAKKRSCHKCPADIKINCNLYRKNGFYHPAPLSILDKLLTSGKFQKMIYEDEFYKQIDLEFSIRSENSGFFNVT